MCVHAQRTRCGACGFQVPTWVDWGRDRRWSDGSTHGPNDRRNDAAVCGCQRTHRAAGGRRATPACVGCPLSGRGWDWAPVCLPFDGRRVGCWWVDTEHDIGTTVLLYVLMVSFFVVIPLPRAVGVDAGRRKRIGRAWAIAAAGYLVVLVPATTGLTLLVVS